jgi:hypothetical protein
LNAYLLQAVAGVVALAALMLELQVAAAADK